MMNRFKKLAIRFGFVKKRKQATSGTDQIILEFIEAMGLKGDLVRDMKIIIPLDGAVTKKGTHGIEEIRIN